MGDAPTARRPAAQSEGLAGLDRPAKRSKHAG